VVKNPRKLGNAIYLKKLSKPYRHKSMQHQRERKEPIPRKVNSSLSNPNELLKKQESTERPVEDMKLVPDDYKRRTSSTVPFGYEDDGLIEGYLKAIPQELDVLREVAESVYLGEISLGVGVDWLEAETGRSMSKMGLKKYVDKKYGRLGKKS